MGSLSFLCIGMVFEMFKNLNLVLCMQKMVDHLFLPLTAHVFENEHSRAVNKLSFHPREPNVLLSGSQDSSMKIFVRPLILWVLGILHWLLNAGYKSQEISPDLQSC